MAWLLLNQYLITSRWLLECLASWSEGLASRSQLKFFGHVQNSWVGSLSDAEQGRPPRAWSSWSDRQRQPTITWHWRGTVGRLEAYPLGMQAALSLIPTSGTFFHGDLVMKKFLRPFSLFRWFKKSSCQLLAKNVSLCTGKLPRRLAQEQCG